MFDSAPQSVNQTEKKPNEAANEALYKDKLKKAGINQCRFLCLIRRHVKTYKIWAFVGCNSFSGRMFWRNEFRK